MQQTPTPGRASRLRPAASFSGFVTGFLRGRDMRHGAQTPPQGCHGPVLSQARGHVGNVVHEWQYDPLLLATRLDLMRSIHQACVWVDGWVGVGVSFLATTNVHGYICMYVYIQTYAERERHTHTLTHTHNHTQPHNTGNPRSQTLRRREPADVGPRLAGVRSLHCCASLSWVHRHAARRRPCAGDAGRHEGSRRAIPEPLASSRVLFAAVAGADRPDAGPQI